ncbi:hypothetical protein [Polaromonas sp. UC242_47]|uniref:hypothetical protein n=1 Tax=Polaromonas sp. UC242_47 TaxID=3374626 RepID=UPI0037AB719E
MAGWFIESSKVKKRYFGKRRMGTSRRLSKWRFKRLHNLARQAVKQIRRALTRFPVGGWGLQPKGLRRQASKKAAGHLLFQAPRIDQKIHFKNFGRSYLAVTGKTYAKLA